MRVAKIVAKQEQSQAVKQQEKCIDAPLINRTGGLYPVVTELRAKGQSLQAIADDLNNQGHTTRRGKAWNPMQVRRVLKRIG